MAAPKVTSADFDPLDKLRAEYFEAGKKSEREYRTKRVESARRGGRRHGVAEGKRQEQAKRAQRAGDRARTLQNIRDIRGRRTEEEKASARRGAYRAGVADARREAARLTQPSRRPARQQASPARRVPSYSPPSFNIGVGIDKSSASRTIVILLVLSAGGVLASSAFAQKKVGPTYMKAGDHTIKVPAHLRGLAATLILGTIALLVAEVNPQLGVVLMGVFAIAVFADLFTGGGIADQLSVTLLGGRSAQGPSGKSIATPGTTVTGPGGDTFYTGPSGSRLVPVPGHPGNYSIEPLPGKPSAGQVSA
jgi:hypothetical protein